MRWFFMLCIALPLAAQAQQPPEWFSESFLDIREDVAEAAKESKRLMVYFGQDGCPYCIQLMEVTFKDPAVVARMRKEFVAIAINILGDREVTWTDGRRMSEKQFAALLKVHATPTLLFFDGKAGIALRINGYLPPREFEARLAGMDPRN